MSRKGRVQRTTRESDVLVEIDVDGVGNVDVATGVGFFDHMLTQLGKHGLFDLTVKAEGDLHVDAHHTVEDTAIALGEAFAQALGDKAGVRRFADALVPLDETLVRVAVDLSGRPYVVHSEPEGLAPLIGEYDTSMTRPQRAPRGRGAVQGRGPGAARRGRARPAGHGRAVHQGFPVRPKLVVLDYGSGNLRSAERAVARAGADVTITADRAAAMSADGLVVPGVGAFAACMAGLRGVRGPEVIGRRLAGGRAVLGICVGMQVLFERGVEHGVQTRGCGEWPGVVERIDAKILPHMGWNTVAAAPGSVLFRGVEDARFYFVHSYGVRQWTMPEMPHFHPPLVTWAEHGERFVAAVENGPLCATQFHPEKSGDAGATLLENWLGTLR